MEMSWLLNWRGNGSAPISFSGGGGGASRGLGPEHLEERTPLAYMFLEGIVEGLCPFSLVPNLRGEAAGGGEGEGF